jgi:hypothetical protein
VTPVANGDTLFSFDSSADRYWLIEIEDIASFSVTDLTIGAVVLGESFTLPLSPDINVAHGFKETGVNVKEGDGGKRFADPRWVKANNSTRGSGNYITFRGNTGATQIPGRETYSVNYSFIADTALLPSNIGAPSGNSLAVNVFAKTGWQTIPFVFSIASGSTSQGDYLFARLAGNSYSITQGANTVYNTSFTVEQEF